MKYVQPASLTWWASFGPLAGGVIIALGAAIPSLAPLVAVINEASGGLPAPVLINMGLIGIGIVGRTGK